jgi:hypothetical protein
MAFDEKQIKEANEELELKLSADRSEWKNKITEIVNKIRNVNELTECQIQMLSYRQILIDKAVDFKNTLYKRNSLFDRYFKNKYREYTLNYDIKLSGGEKVQFIKADLSHLKTQIDMLQSHIDYYQECVKTLDNMAFAIKNRIKIADEHY